MKQNSDELYVALRKIVLLSAGLLILLWFLYTIREVILLFLFAASLAVALNSPVIWLEEKGVPRHAALLVVLLLLIIVLGLFAWILVPRLAADLSTLTENLPRYVEGLRSRLLTFLSRYPALERNVNLDTALPSAGQVLGSVGRYSLSLFGWLAVLFLLSSVVIYMVAYPVSLLEVYQQLLPLRWREAGTEAFVHASEMISGWVRANVIAGLLEAAAVTVVLSILNVPSALVWGALAFFAELVPRLGLYLMAIPPILVALAVEPLKAVWVTLFYVALDQAMGNLVLPRVQQETMDLHPVLILFAIFALAAAFGLVGALLAVPLAAILKAYFQAFFLEQRPQDPSMDNRVERMLQASNSAPSTRAAEVE